MLTFGQYNVLAATRQRATRDQLAKKTEFNDLMVSYYAAGLLAQGLITTIRENDTVCYQLTDMGVSYLTDYERNNPELAVTRAFLLDLPN